ncbi:glycosyltransferase family 4 protein [Alteromonas sp. ASW11-36]|uniref:Glycosyltransferase family 4 protein n=1 Tax=Alteromonas arenosi TaxID=3055817 RepID=A0ABT7STX7_9ALTE|nr:glycosyltransferase family 4 protein [Alteromonas sp. ASW11-36]MDM7859636.1 glycosyltransferase family 4 protein [Alteromonas sp. ASW11-36]
MNSQYFTDFPEKSDVSAVNVLTIAAAFPSLVQPWLVNHLVQIAKHGGDNRIISRREEHSVFTDAIRDNHLLDKYCCLPDDKVSLFKFYVQSHFNSDIRRATQHLWKSYNSTGTSLKTRVFDRFSAPAFSIKPDIIHSHSELVGSKFVRLIQATRLPFVATFHGLPPVGVPLISDSQRKAYVNATDVIFVNTEFAKSQYESLGAPSDRFAIIPQGIDLSRWPFMPRSFPEDGKVQLLTVGRLHPDKGHRYALRALKTLLARGTNIHYTIVGSGPERENIQHLAQSMGIANNVEIHTGIPDEQLAQIYARSHIFLLPSLRSKDGYHEETQGVVLQEAQATGLITVATRSGGIPECIDDGVSGYLVPDRDSDAIADMLTGVIDNQANWQTIQRKARQWVETHFSAEIIGAKMNAVYRDVIGRT